MKIFEQHANTCFRSWRTVFFKSTYNVIEIYNKCTQTLMK